MEPELVVGRYRHYKGNFYQVLGVATHSETNEPLVVYQPEYGDKALWVRPLTMFSEQVLVNGQMVSRFCYVADTVQTLDSSEESV